MPQTPARERRSRPFRPQLATPGPRSFTKKREHVPEWKFERFLEYLSEIAAPHRACEYAMICLDEIIKRRKNDAVWNERYEDAYRRGWLRLEEIAVQRAFFGVLTPIYRDGKQVDTVVKFSDSLVQFLLKGNFKSKYSERTENINVNRDAAGGERFATLSDEELEEELRKRRE